MALTGPEKRARRGRRAGFFFAAALVIATTITVGLYTAVATTGSNTLVIVPLGGPVGPGGGGGGGGGSTGPANFTDIGDDVQSNPKQGKKIKGRLLTQIDLPSGLETGNLVLDLLWTNSVDVKGPLDKDNGYLHVGLYFMDSDQQKAKDKDYIGDCDDLTQLEWKEKVVVPDNDDDDDDDKDKDKDKDKTKDVKRYLCPDISANSQNNLSKFLANGILASSINGHSTLYLVADIPKVPKPPKPPKDEEVDDDDDDDSKNTKDTKTASALGWEKASQIGKLEFNISLIAI